MNNHPPAPAEAGTAPVVSVEGVSFAYGNQWVLEGIDWQIMERDFIGLIGPNGGGKTTLLKLILGLFKPTTGRVRLFDQPPETGRRMVGYVPQYTQFDRDFPVRVIDVVLMGRLRTAPVWGRYRAEDRDAAHEALETMEVADLRNRSMGELSGGQLQRVLIARSLAGRPRLLALDEPTANIDARVQKEFPELLSRLNKRMTIILISHDLGFISSHVNRVACLNRRLICHPTSCITGQVIDELYRGHVHMVHHTHEV